MRKPSIILLFATLLGLFTACKSSKETASGGEKRASAGSEMAIMNNFMNGNKEKILGNYEPAIDYFNRCIKLDPDHAASYYELANIYEFQGKDMMALSHIKKAVELDGSNLWYQRLLGLVYEKHGMFAEAANVYEGVVKAKPEDIDAWYDLANAYNTSQRLDKAVEVFERLEKQVGENEETMLQKHRLYMRMGESGKAIAELEKLIEFSPAEPRYYGLLAELYTKEGEQEKALEVYKQLQEVDPNNPYVHLSMAEYHKANGDAEKAFESQKKAFASASLDIDTKVQLLLGYYTRTERDPTEKPQAYELCEILVETHALDARAHSIHGDFLYRDKKRIEARQAFAKAVELAPEKFVIWNQLLLINSELRDWQSMYEQSGEAMEVFPSQPAFYLYNGIAANQLSKHEEAIEALTSGKMLIIDNPQLEAQFQANLGEAYHATKEYDSSDRAYESAIALEPENAGTLNNYAYYLSLRGQKLDRAAELSQKSNDLAPNQPSYLDTYAWILYKMARYKEAEEYMKRAIEHGGSKNDVILEHYGDILFKLGNKAEAVEYWKKARGFGEGSGKLDQKIDQQNLLE